MTVEQARNTLHFCDVVELYEPETAFAMREEVNERLGRGQPPLAGLGTVVWRQIQHFLRFLYLDDNGKAEVSDIYFRHWTIPVEYIRCEVQP